MKIYIIGDSISCQYGPYLEAYLDGIMDYSRKGENEEALLGVENPQGQNGGDSNMVLRFLKAKVAADDIDADLLLINCGLHDIKTHPETGQKQVPLNRYKKNLADIIDISKKMKPQLVWIRTTPCDEHVHNRKEGMKFHRFAQDCRDYNQAADEIMREHSIPTIDLYSFTKNLGQNLYCDHVHFHTHVREKQAAFIAGWLMREAMFLESSVL